MHLSGSLKTSVHAFAKLTPSSVASHKNNTQKDTTMTDLSLWQSASLPNTVDHVLERYHATHRRQLADAVQLAEKVASRHENFPADLVGLLQAIEAELSSHMMKEERMLFPMIKNGMGRNAGMPIRVMMMEHEDHESALAQLMETTHNFTAPDDACSNWQQLYADLKTFADDLNDHIQLENTILFPRALNE